MSGATCILITQQPLLFNCLDGPAKSLANMILFVLKKKKKKQSGRADTAIPKTRYGKRGWDDKLAQGHGTVPGRFKTSER